MWMPVNLIQTTTYPIRILNVNTKLIKMSNYFNYNNDKILITKWKFNKLRM